MHKRRGFALLTVLLVGAVLLASVFMFAKAVGTEQYIGQTGEYFRLALDMAEAGVTRTIQDLRLERSAGVIGGSYLTPVKFDAVKASTGPVDLDEVVYSELTSARKVGTYHVWVRHKENLPDLPNGSHVMIVTVKSEGRVYPSNVTLPEQMTATNYQSRRFVGVDVKVVLSGVPERLRLAVFSKSDMTISGGATVLDGNAFSNTTITFRGGGGMVNGKASSTLGGDVPATGEVITFPKIDLPKFQDLAWAFVNGESPYDTGLTKIDPLKPVDPDHPYDNTDPNFTNYYPKTSAPSDWSLALGPELAALRDAYEYDAVGDYHYLTSEDFEGTISTFMTTVQGMVTANPGWPRNLLSAAVFYFKGNVSQTQATDWHAGTFVIDGDLKLVGKSTNTTGAPGVLPAVYASGTIRMEGTPGTSSERRRLEGLFVSDTGFDIQSNVTVRGAVWSGGTLALGGNDVHSEPRAKVWYDPNIENVPFTFYRETGGVMATPMASTWKELPN